MSQLSAGMLSCRVTVQESVWQKDRFGAPHRQWIDRTRIWANIEPVTARNSVLSQQLSTEVTHYITVRFNNLFAAPLNSTAFRLIHGERIYGITGVINDSNRNVSITIQAVEIQSDDAE